MQVPEYWATEKQIVRDESRSRTIQRFGWSDVSAAEAQSHARERLAEAVELFRTGRSIDVREPKVPYNGGDGLPIREQVISRHGETVITRNSYGALCLNTPNVLFADVDAEIPGGCRAYVGAFVITAGLQWLAAWWMGLEIGFWLPVFNAMLFGALIGSGLHAIGNLIVGTPQQAAWARIEAFARRHPAWSIRVYETPRGWRLLVTHATFDPRGADAQALFMAIRADPLYVRMCFNQNCFRARVSPKPWRIGIDQHLRPRPGVWPITDDRLPDRVAWVKQYENQAAAYAACRYAQTLGTGRPCREAIDVMRLHDEFSDAISGKPIA